MIYEPQKKNDNGQLLSTNSETGYSSQKQNSAIIYQYLQNQWHISNEIFLFGTSNTTT